MDIFCKIIKKEIPSNIIYEDDIVMVIMDVNPRSNGHLLVISKEHYTDLFDISNNVLGHIMKIAKDISNKLIEKLNCEGITLENNSGIVQDVKHFHMHIIPKYKNNNQLKDLNEIYKLLKERF